MCDRFISMYLKNFRLGYQFMIFRGHLNRDHSSTITKKLFSKSHDQYYCVTISLVCIIKILG